MLGDEPAEPEQCRSQYWACLNDAKYSVTHPSCTPTVGPTASVFFRYTDTVLFGQWVVLLETDGHLDVAPVNSQQGPVSLNISCKETVRCQFVTECDAPAGSEIVTLLFGKHEAWSGSSRTEFRRCRAPSQRCTRPKCEPAFLFWGNRASY